MKILFSKDVLSVHMFERNEILALIVTLGKYSDAIQFIEEMEQQIVIKELKANIQGYVDVDNELNQVNEIDASEQEFDTLIDKTFGNIFQSDLSDSCNEWQSFCENGENINGENQQVQQKICSLYRQYCSL